MEKVLYQRYLEVYAINFKRKKKKSVTYIGLVGHECPKVQGSIASSPWADLALVSGSVHIF